MSPPLVVAFALAGPRDDRFDNGADRQGQRMASDVYLKDIWPSSERSARRDASPPSNRKSFAGSTAILPRRIRSGTKFPSSTGEVYQWDDQSTYIQEPPFFEKFSLQPGRITEIKGARPLGIFGDSVTTDHISPAGSIKKTSPAGKYLVDQRR